MNIIKGQELQNRISNILAQAIPEGWVTAKVTVTGRSERMIDIVCEYTDNKGKSHVWNETPNEVGRLLLDLRKGMAANDLSSRWTKALFTFSSSKKSVSVEYSYADSASRTVSTTIKGGYPKIVLITAILIIVIAVIGSIYFKK